MSRTDAVGAWSSRSLGSRLQHRIFYLLIRVGGRRAAYLLLFFVVWYYVLCRRDVRARCQPYLRHRFPQHGARPRLGDCFRMSHALGQSLVDRATVGIAGPGALKITVTGHDELLRMVHEGRGLILLIAHVGCWQAAMSALKFLRVPVNLLMQREEGDIDRHYFEHAGVACPYRLIDPNGFLGGTIDLLQALKWGEVVSMMGDRMLGADQNGVVVPFLGEAARFPVSAYRLASLTDAPIAVLLSAKTGPDEYLLDLHDIIRVPAGLSRRPEAYAPYVGQFAAALEDYCRKHPFQFFNFYDMWDQRADGRRPD